MSLIINLKVTAVSLYLFVLLFCFAKTAIKEVK